VGLWLSVVFISCSVLAWFLSEFGPDLTAIAHFLLSVVSWSPSLELAFVGILTPCFLGFFQVWVTDDFLKLGGLPLSEVVTTLAARLYPTAPLPGSWAPRTEFARPLLGGPGIAATVTGFASGFNFTNPLLVVDAPKTKVAPLSEMYSGTPSPQNAGGTWYSSPKAAVAQEEPKTHRHTDLQKALEGMESQVARALGCHPVCMDAEERAALVVDMHADPFFAKPWAQSGHCEEADVGNGYSFESRPDDSFVAERVASRAASRAASRGRSRSRSQGREGGVDFFADTPELEELKARIQQKDMLLHRLRNELQRVDNPPAVPVLEESVPSPRDPGRDTNRSYSSFSARIRNVVDQPYQPGPSWSAACGEPSWSTSPVQAERTSAEQSSDDHLLARYAAPQLPGAQARRELGPMSSRQPSPQWDMRRPIDTSGAQLDGKLAALEAKINRLSGPPGYGNGQPARGSYR